MKKPSDLVIPFSFDQRKPINLDSFFFVPDFYKNHQEWGTLDLADEAIFPKKNPVHIEYCSGNGQWIIEKAKNNPNINWIAVEYLFDRARKIWLKKHNYGLKNLFVVFGEASCFTKYYLKDDSISNIFINFPDPWPKKKHIKNRLVNPCFMTEVSRIVQKNGVATLVTDDNDAKDWMAEACISSKKWESIYEYPYFVSSIEHYGDSYFDTLWRTKGKEIKYLQFSNLK